MSLENQVARVSQGAKDTLKALINMMGGNITDELIDQYPAIASQLLPPTGITGNTVTVTAKEQLDAGNMIIILQNGDGYDAYKATTEGVATSNFWLGIAKDTVLSDATADVISIAYMEASSDFVVEQNNGNEQKFWVGTNAEYQAIVVKDPNTMYLVTDDCGAVKGYITEAEYAALLATVNGKAEAEHTHTKSQVTDFAHSHEMTDVNGINSALSGKASTTHASTHAANGSDPLTLSIGQVSNLQTSLDTKANASNVYTKTESDTLLQNKLGGIESTDYPGCYYRTVDGVVEWYNPPMKLGDEYRTTERYLGKTVYTTAVDLGNAVSGGDITVTNWLPNSIKILRAIGSVASGATWHDSASMSIVPAYPYGINGSDTSWDIYIKSADRSKCVVYTGTSQVGRKVIVTAWYTKD